MEGSEYQFDSLRDIELRKAKLRGEIKTQEKSMGKLWDSLFHNKSQKAMNTRQQKMTKLFSTGIGVVDGAMLAWKLYRKFKK